MLAVHLEAGSVSVRDVPKPGRPAGFAVVKLLAAGVCNTDLELRMGYYGFAGTPGHEFAGLVVESESPEWVGRRVVGEINLACHACAMCAKGLDRHCPNRTVLGIVKHPGAFQEFFTLPERNLRAIPDEISTEEAVFVEPLAAACEILDQVQIPAGAAVAVLGQGKLGLLISRMLIAHGYDVKAFNRRDQKPTAAFDWIVEATGSPEGLPEAIRMARPRGAVFMKSTIHAPVAIDTAAAIVNELTLVGSRCGRFEPAIELLRARKVDVSDMIAAVYPLAEAAAVFGHAAQPGTLKVLLKP